MGTDQGQGAIIREADELFLYKVDVSGTYHQV